MGCKLKKMNLTDTLNNLNYEATQHVQTIIRQHPILKDFIIEDLYRARGQNRICFKEGLDSQFKSYTERRWDIDYGSVINYKCMAEAYKSIKPNNLVRQCMYMVFGRFGFTRFNRDLWAVN